MKKTCLISLVVLFSTIASFAQENYSQWAAYREIALNTTATGANVTGTVTSFPVLVRLTSATADVFAQAQANGADIRFTASDGTTRFPHQRERWDATGQVAEFWVLVPSAVGNANTVFRMYWGKSGAADSSNGSQVFSTANGFMGVWHLGDAPGTSDRPNAVGGSSPSAVLQNFPAGYDATKPGYVNTGSGVNNSGLIGYADTLQGGANQITAISRNYIDLGRTSSGVKHGYFGTTSTSPFSTGLSYSIWVYEEIAGSFARYLQAAADTTNTATAGKLLLLRNGTNGNLCERVEGNSNSNGNSTTTPLVVGAWQQVALIKASGSSVPVIYHNGAQLTLNGSSAVTISGNIARDFVWLGRSNSTSTSDAFLQGKLDEAVMSNIPRNADWVKLSYETQKPGATCVSLGSTVPNTPAAPSGLSYLLNPAVYTVGTAIANNTPTVTGTVTAYAVSPALPGGLSLNTSTGVISGTPTIAAAAAAYVVTAGNGGGSTTVTVNITVNAAAPTNLAYSVNPATYTVGTAIVNNTPSNAGGTPTGYAVTPALPGGLTFNTSTGVISGTPITAVAAANYTVTASNGAGSTTAQLNITVSASVVAPANLTYSPNPAVYGLNVPIANNSPAYTGGAPASFAVNPALPAGLSLNTTTGVVSGTPTAAQAAAVYAVTATNTAGSSSANLSIAVLAAPSGLTYSVNPATYGVGVGIVPNTPTVTGTVASYAVSPTLPVGLSLNTATGVITGTPTAAQASSSYTVTAANAGGSITVGLGITILVVPSGLTYSAPTASYLVGSAIVPNTPTVSGTITTYAVSPALPAGLSLNATTGVITGTPTATQAATNYTVTASNAAGSTTAALNFTVTAVIGVNWKTGIPNAFVVRFSGVSSLSFTLPGAGAEQIRFTITDMQGRAVWSRTVDLRNSASRELTWNGSTGARAGLYLIRMTALDSKRRVCAVAQKKVVYTP